ncbi:hypothetical protein KKG63_01960, partial [Patescibacteria group bacterium]|nr:hypothetical protein [Patescibacteria group bacterium]
YRLASNFIKNYDELLGLGERSGKIGPCIVFKVSGGHEASRKITRVLNADGIGTNNTVVYTVAQEVQLILDAFEGKAKASKNGKQVIRTYETNMGGRFVSHLREIEAEKIFVAAENKVGNDMVSELLDMLSDYLNVDSNELKNIKSASIADKARAICSFKYLKSLNTPALLRVAEAADQSIESVKILEEDLKKAGTLVARRVYWIFFSPENRPKWVSYLQRTYDLDSNQAVWLHKSMDVLPASKRIPEDSYHALGSKNMCHTEFPNHTRAVHVFSEADTFNINDFKESILDTYEPEVVERLSMLPDFFKGYNLTPVLKYFLMNEVGIAVDSWQTDGLEPEKWSEFGAVVKTSEEFSEAYNAFAARCVKIAKESANN